MRAEQRVIFITDDGAEFIDEAAAKEHEAQLSIAEALQESGIYWRDTDPGEVAAVLVKLFNISPKEPRDGRG